MDARFQSQPTKAEPVDAAGAPDDEIEVTPRYD
jgi:hypothetical protein